MSENLDDILHDCLERLASGERVSDCIERYPEHREELAPLLEVAVATMGAAASVAPRPEARSRGLYRLTGLVEREGVPRPRRLRWLYRAPALAKPLAIVLIAALFTTGMAAGAGVASTDSVPGDPLYWVKTTRESISLMVPRSDVDKAKTHIRLARERGEEMGELMVKGRVGEAERLERRLKGHLNSSAVLVGLTAATNPMEMPYRPAMLHHPRNAAALMDQLERDRVFLRARLIELVQGTPPGLRPKMVMLRRRTEFGFYTLVAALEGNDSQALPAFWRAEPPRPRRR